MNEIINIYSDESCHLENDHHKSMVLGGIYCPISKVKDYSIEIRNIKEKYNINKNQEIKWTKISPSMYNFYTEILDIFLKNDDINFRALKIPNKSIIDHKSYGQNHNDWYYKMYYDMLKQIITPHKEYNIYIDIKDTEGQDKVDELNRILSIPTEKKSSKILKVQQIRSHESNMLQLADILIGAIGYRDRNPKANKNSAKLKICKHIENKLKISLNNTSCYTNRKFNLLVWESKK